MRVRAAVRQLTVGRGHRKKTKSVGLCTADSVLKCVSQSLWIGDLHDALEQNRTKRKFPRLSTAVGAKTGQPSLRNETHVRNIRGTFDRKDCEACAGGFACKPCKALLIGAKIDPPAVVARTVRAALSIDFTSRGCA